MTNTTCLERLLELRAKHQLALQKATEQSEREWHKALLDTVDIQLNSYFKLHTHIEDFESQMEDIKYTRVYLSDVEIEVLKMFLSTSDYITTELRQHAETTDNLMAVYAVAKYKTLRQVFPKQLKQFLSNKTEHVEYTE